MVFYLSKSNLYRKPKWSVWSIRTTFKGWDWKLLTEKTRYGQKITIWRGGKFQNPVLRSREGFEGFYKAKIDLKNIVTPSATIPAQFSYILILF